MGNELSTCREGVAVLEAEVARLHLEDLGVEQSPAQDPPISGAARGMIYVGVREEMCPDCYLACPPFSKFTNLPLVGLLCHLSMTVHKDTIMPFCFHKAVSIYTLA